MELKELLITTPGIKQASIDIPSKQQYESDFGKMAYVFLQDRVPQMIPYLVGFEVVEQEPDGTKAVGMFGFRVGDRFYYIPVFFINNQIKGMESIYDRNADLMAPLMEEAVNDIINRKNIEIGGAPEEADPTGDLMAPDLTVLSRPPNQGTDNYKYASAMEDLCDVWNDMQKRAADLLKTDEVFQKMFGNAIISVKGGEFEKAASSDLVTYLKHYGGPEAVKSLWTKMSEDLGFARAAATFYDLKEDLSINEFDEALAPKQAQASLVRVITPETKHENLGEAEGTKLLSQGFVIEDDRDDEDKSQIYSYEPTSEIINPTDKGIYNVALAGNRVEKCMILKPSIGRVNPHMVVVRKVDGTDSFTASSDRVFILGSHEDPQDLRDAVKSQSIPIADAKDHTKYVLVDEDGNCSSPFRIRYGASGDREHVNYMLNWCDDLQYTGSNAHRADHEWVRNVPGERDSTYYPQDDELVVRPGKGKAKMLNESLVVPEESYRLLKVEKDYDECCMAVDPDAPERKPEEKFYPASYTEVTENLIKQSMHELRIDAYDQGSSFLISLDGMKDSRDPVNYKTASVRLVRDYGLPVESAEIMLKEASTRFKSDRMVKLAQVIMPQMQMPPSPYMGDAGIPVQEDWVNTQEGMTVGRGTPPQSGPRFGGEAELQQDPAALAQEAAALGQQQVFDHAGIAGMAGTNDTSAMIDTFIPTWVDSLDKLGRLMFLFYWKNEEFAERFGSDDIADLEDKIRNVYSKFGELVYELKKKTIGAQAGDLI